MADNKRQISAERWLQIKQVFHAALDRNPRDRAAFLNEACGGDDELRNEVESLIAAHEQPDGFIDKPAVEVAAELLATGVSAATIGRAIGPYKILQQIGRGGMGEVYLARDARLGRRVALKMLPSRFTTDEDRLRRFKQEARAASALNHPNIITIHEVGQIDDAHFIATEFVEGQTLRARIESGQMTVSESIDVVIQVASALRAAHEAGIVHRDIKPENIMLRPDGYVKVVDFGLAKLSERPTVTDDSSGSFMAIDTSPGMLMGTVTYMSPEQARGLAVDARTDIFSLGVVLYEMLAGRPPFQCASIGALILTILEKEPPALSLYTTEATAELEPIITKALRKNADDRYQSAKDLLEDLRKLKQDLEIRVRMESNSAEESAAGVRASASGEHASAGSGGVAAASSGADTKGAIKISKRRVAAGLTALFLITAIVAGALLLAVAPKTIDSIAVMPFANAGADPNTDYLPDGITESIINSLSQLPELRVMASSTVFAYKGREADPRKIGEELRVRAVVTGRVLQRGETLMITANLVDTKDGSQLWGKQYDRIITDVLRVQEEIAREIVDILRLSLTGNKKKQVTKRYTENVDAYQLYIKGRYYLSKFNKDGFRKGLDHFQQAIDLDPNYAKAYTGIADAYYGFSNIYLPAKEAMPKSRAAAMKALELDETLAEAHASLAVVKAQYDWEWAEAEREYKRAIEISPGYASVHWMYGIYLVAMGRPEEALRELRRAKELDPLSVSIDVTAVFPYYYVPISLRQYDRAIAELRIIVAMNPDFPSAHGLLGQAYAHKGMHDEAVAEMSKAWQLDDNLIENLAILGYTYAVAGKKYEANKALEEVRQRSKQQHVTAFSRVILYSGLGEKDHALEWLEKAYEARDEQLVLLNVEPMLDGLRSDSRFQNLLQRMNLAR